MGFDASFLNFCIMYCCFGAEKRMRIVKIPEEERTLYNQQAYGTYVFSFVIFGY